MVIVPQVLKHVAVTVNAVNVVVVEIAEIVVEVESVVVNAAVVVQEQVTARAVAVEHVVVAVINNNILRILNKTCNNVTTEKNETS